MTPLSDLRARAKSLRDDAKDARRYYRAAKLEARDGAEELAAVEQALEREEWREAQIELGVDPDEIDVTRRIVTDRPLGTAYVVRLETDPDTEAVSMRVETLEADSTEAAKLRAEETV